MGPKRWTQIGRSQWLVLSDDMVAVDSAAIMATLRAAGPQFSTHFSLDRKEEPIGIEYRISIKLEHFYAYWEVVCGRSSKERPRGESLLLTAKVKMLRREHAIIMGT